MARCLAAAGCLALLCASSAVAQTPAELARAAQSLDSSSGSIVAAALSGIIDLGASPCTRLVGTDSLGKQVDAGCSSPRRGITGLLFPAASAADVLELSRGARADGYNRVVVIDARSMTRSVWDAMKAAASAEAATEGGSEGAPGTSLAGIAGAVVLLSNHTDNPPLSSAFSLASTDGTAMGRRVSGETEWNADGVGLLGERLNLPVVAVSGDEAARVLQLTADNLSGHGGPPRWGARFRYFMGPAEMSSESCLQQHQCLPIGGQSVWATIGGDVDDLAAPGAAAGSGMRPGQEGWILLAARADASSLFHGRAAGHVSAVGNLIVTLAAAAALASEPQTASLRYRPIVALMQAETAGRAGSRRFVREAVAAPACTKQVPRSLTPYGRLGCLEPAVRPDFASLPGMGLANTTAGLAGALAVELPPSVLSLRGPGAVPQRLFLHQTASGAIGQQAVRAMAEEVAGDLRSQGRLLLPGGLVVEQGGFSASRPLSESPSEVLPPSPLDSLLDPADAGAAKADQLLRAGTAVISGGYAGAGNVTASLHSAADSATLGPQSLSVDALTDAASFVAGLVFTMGKQGVAVVDAPAAPGLGATPSGLVASRAFVSALLECFQSDAACPLAQGVTGLDADTLRAFALGSGGGAGDWGGGAASQPPPLFPGIYSAPVETRGGGATVLPTWAEKLIRDTLANITANVTTSTPCSSDADCRKAGLSPRAECLHHVGFCGRSSAHYIDALSPAVVVERSDPNDVNASLLTAEDPAWAEPYWSARIRTELLVVPAPDSEWKAVIAGALVTVAAAGATYWWLSRGKGGLVIL